MRFALNMSVLILLMSINTLYGKSEIELFRRSIKITLNDKDFCSGVLINHNTVITARHCVDNKDMKRLAVKWRNELFQIEKIKYPTQKFSYPLNDIAELQIGNHQSHILTNELNVADGYYILLDEHLNQPMPISIEQLNLKRLPNVVSFRRPDVKELGVGRSGSAIYRVTKKQAHLYAILTGELSVLTRGHSFLANRWHQPWSETEAKKSNSDDFKSICERNYDDSQQWIIFHDVLGQIAEALELNEVDVKKIYNDCQFAEEQWNVFKKEKTLIIDGDNNFDVASLRFLKDVKSIKLSNVTSQQLKWILQFKDLQQLELENICTACDLNFLTKYKHLTSLTLSYGEQLKLSSFKPLSQLKSLSLIDIHFDKELSQSEKNILSTKLKCPIWRVRYGKKNLPISQCPKEHRKEFI